MTLDELASAQDEMNAEITAAVEAFLAKSPEVTFSNGNIFVTNDVSGPRVRAVTSVEGSFNGARISRRAPENV